MSARVPNTPPPLAGGANREIWSVSRLNLEARALLEHSFATLWVEGEMSNLARPRSGHIYFSLKDEQCQVRCAMFRMHNRRLAFEPRDGVQVLAQVRVSLYAERGEYQLIVQQLEEAGAGALRRAFDALKARLAAEGLFDAAGKRAIPTLPRQVGIITSPTGAAIRDVLSVLARRFPSLPVLVYPVPVQGAEAAPAIVRALDRAASDRQCDVLILTRGGGSLEDLWPFNEESVARAIARCPIPLVSGIGHEVDFTIADFVADQRAATPSAAAELVSPDAREWRARRDAALRRLAALAGARLRGDRQALAWLLRRLIHPQRRVAELGQRRTALLARLTRATAARIAIARQRVATLDAKLGRHHPATRLRAMREQARALLTRLERAQAAQHARMRDRLAASLRAIETVSPQRTLERGYAIVTRTADGSVLRTPQQVTRGDAVMARLAGGTIRLRVEE